MNTFSTSTSSKLILLFILGTFLFIGFLGLGLTMNMHSDGQMSDCPFMGAEVICQMNPLEHIAAWQNMFSTMPNKDIFSLMTLLILSIFLSFFIKDFWSDYKILQRNQRLIFQTERLFFNNPLQEAFSKGILNTKVY